MNSEDKITQNARTWQSKLHFRFDDTCMPRIIPILGVTKNEIATKIMHSRNAERATKVMTGGSTDMKDMLALCARYDIDLAQLLLLPNGKHPVIITEEEYYGLKEAAKSSSGNDNNEQLGGKTVSQKNAEELLPRRTETTIGVSDLHIDDTNAAFIINNMRESTTKIHSLYERIIELTAENARMKAMLSHNNLKE